MQPNGCKSTTNHPTGKTSGGYAHRRQGGKSGYSILPCRHKDNCDNSCCTYTGHTRKEDITIKEGKHRAEALAAAGGGAVASRPQFPRFDKRSHLPVPDPQKVPNPEKALFKEFLSSQMKIFHSVLTKGMPNLLKILLLKDL